MGFFQKVFGLKSKEEKLKERQEKAKAAWAGALASGDEGAMEDAASDLSLAELHEDYVQALHMLAERFPQKAWNHHNNLGVHYFFEGDYEKAFDEYVRSYNLDEEGAGSAAESNILEVCQKMAEESDDQKDAVKYMMRYFRICTRKPDPSWTVENIDMLSVFRSNERSMLEDRAESAEEAIEQVEELLQEIEDAAFVAGVRKELSAVSEQLRP